MLAKRGVIDSLAENIWRSFFNMRYGLADLAYPLVRASQPGAAECAEDGDVERRGSRWNM